MKAFSRWILLLVLCLPGCHRYLVATPNLYHDQDARKVYGDCAKDCLAPDVPVLYATDRADDGESKDRPTYGYKRSTSLAFGIAQVRLNPNPSWEELIEASTKPKRAREFELRLADAKEVGRIAPQFDRAMINPVGAEITRTVAEQIVAQRNQFHELLRNKLAQTAHKDVYIFVHGFNNSFEDAVFRAAEVWHFMGRVGVPIAYTWPAGLGGIRGYAYDRESGEFTVTHLRRFLKMVADSPDVERVHIIAHSRGTDVAISALRELHLSYRAAGMSTQKQLKLENLILAAPDVDEEVFMQRFVGENLLQAAKRTTIYASEHDRAIELSDVIFASRRRLGVLGSKDFSPKMKHALSKLPNVQFIECKLSGLSTTHSYVFTHPAALSDLILVLRDRRDPGIANGRPLRQPAEGVWELTDDYLARKTP